MLALLLTASAVPLQGSAVNGGIASLFRSEHRGLTASAAGNADVYTAQDLKNMQDFLLGRKADEKL